MGTPKLSWRATHKGDLLEMELREDGLYFEVGPAEWPARGHQGAGGTLRIEEFISQPEMFSEFDGFYEKVAAALRSAGLTD